MNLSNTRIPVKNPKTCLNFSNLSASYPLTFSEYAELMTSESGRVPSYCYLVRGILPNNKGTCKIKIKQKCCLND